MRFVTSLTLLTLLAIAGTASAQGLDEEGRPIPTTDPAASPTVPDTGAPKLEYGVGIRLRQVFVPKGLLELFVERAAGGASNTGIGVDLVRRRGNLELQLGFEFEHVQPGEGVWINSGDTVPAAQADYMLSAEQAGKSLGWFSIEFTFLNHAPITDKVAVRYGGGAGIGFITGGLQKFDVSCAAGATNENPEPGCVPNAPALGLNGTGAGSGPNDYDLPPVFPVVNAIIGVQVRPTKKAVINVETGIRTIPFIGVSGGYFF